MSASDYITMKKYKNMRNIFTTKESGNNIQKLKINTILNGYKVDEYDDILPNKWFDINLSCPPRNPCDNIEDIDEVENFGCDFEGICDDSCDDSCSSTSEHIRDEMLCCSHSIIFDVTDTRPIMFKTPAMTIEPAIKKRCYPFFGGSPSQPQKPMPVCHQCIPTDIDGFVKHTQMCTNKYFQNPTQKSSDTINVYLQNGEPIKMTDVNNLVFYDKTSK